jgi:hypothetical protein
MAKVAVIRSLAADAFRLCTDGDSIERDMYVDLHLRIFALLVSGPGKMARP